MSFHSWLRLKLESIKSDDEVFSDYIEGLLSSEESEENIVESIKDIMCGLMSDGVDEFIAELIQVWKRSNTSDHTPDDSSKKFEIDSRFYRLLEEQSEDLSVQPNVSDTRSSVCTAFKKEILDQYAQVSDVESDEEGNSDGNKCTNTNLLEVMKAEQERHERLKQEALQKRAKDKSDRVKQKELQNERKDRRRKRALKVERHS